MNEKVMVPAAQIVQQHDYLRWKEGEEVQWIDDLFAMMNEADTDWQKYKVGWAPATKGDWTLETHDIPKDSFERLYHVLQGPKPSLDRDTGYGVTTVLKHKGIVWMSDTRAEILEHTPFINKLWWTNMLEPTVLINGLGLGMAVKAALVHNASHIDVVEIDQEVIDIIGPNFADEPRVTIHHGDAFKMKWPKGKQWVLAWHDIWPTIAVGNIAEMDRLHTRYKHRVQWQASWQRKACIAMRKHEAEFKEALESGDFNRIKALDPDF